MIEQAAEIIFNNKITSDVFLIGLRSSYIAPKARPGQFVMIQVRKDFDPLLRRPFSICGTNDKDLFMILYKVVGKGTAILSGTRKGENISALGPLGNAFELPEANTSPVLVAGGIGVAPLYFLYQRIKRHRVYFMSGFGSSDDVIRAENVSELAVKSVIATDDGGEGYKGVVTDLLNEFLDQSEEKAGNISLYSCGPLPMLKAISKIAHERELPCHVSMECRMACGLGACQGCAVRASSQGKRYLHVCKDGPVFPSQDIDWGNI
ncbi:MAG: dihydroorotate dehydrogenase electron transfer subunit [Deltaproteobacteria bacterium]|nr:dihydroorotate dehydrogenase electron transfer subunit [Deltaproteobacteria bacterium]